MKSIFLSHLLWLATAQAQFPGSDELDLTTLPADFKIPGPVAEQQYDDISTDGSGGAGGAGATMPLVCWITSYGRGVGTIPVCSPDKENDAGLCYTRCPSDYKPVGPICWPNELSYGRGVGTIPNSCGGREMDAGLCYDRCPDGFNPIGPVCWRGIEGRGRGAGSVPNQCPGGKENQAGLCYDRCRNGFHGVGPVCWCDHENIPRGVGTIPDYCDGGEMDAGLCYKRCKDGFKAVGPVCWQDRCPQRFPAKCGAVCATSDEACGNLFMTLIGQGFSVSQGDPMNSLMGLAGPLTSAFGWPKCDDP